MAILSFAKKNAKTSLAAFLLLLHLAGPEAKPNSQLPSTAQSQEQAAVLFKLASKVVQLSPTLAPVITIRDHLKQLYCDELGTLYRALSADAKTAHGQSPIFTVHDELGQVQGPTSELFNAIENAMGAHEHPLSLVLSTQAPTDADLLSVLIDDAKKGTDPHVVLVLYEASDKLDPFSDEAILAANPAAGDFLNMDELRGQAEKARRMPANESLYRNYTLNQRVAAEDPFVTASVWESNGGTGGEGRMWFGGLDLSETSDLTSLELVAPDADAWAVESTFWLPEHEIAERARKDRVPYDQWAKEGHLQLTPGRTVEYSHVAAHLVKRFADRQIRRIAFDRYNMRHLRPWLIQAGLSEAFVDEHFVEYGQGYASMSPALRALEGLLLNGKLRHGGHPVLRMCAANAIVKTDEAGNRKLDKKRSRGRIDGMVALAMACEAASSFLAADDSLRFKAEWWQTWSTAPSGGNTCIIVCGPNDKRAAPETTAWVLRLMPDRNYYVIDGCRERLDVAARTKLVFDWHRKYSPLKVGYEARSYEADRAHIADVQSRENYRFSVTELGGTMTAAEQISRLQPLFSAGRLIMAPRLLRPSGVDLVDVFRRGEFDPYPLAQHVDQLQALARVLDVGADFPRISTWKSPAVFPSDF